MYAKVNLAPAGAPTVSCRHRNVLTNHLDERRATRPRIVRHSWRRVRPPACTYVMNSTFNIARWNFQVEWHKTGERGSTVSYGDVVCVCRSPEETAAGQSLADGPSWVADIMSPSSNRLLRACLLWLRYMLVESSTSQRPLGNSERRCRRQYALHAPVAPQRTPARRTTTTRPAPPRPASSPFHISCFHLRFLVCESACIARVRRFLCTEWASEWVNERTSNRRCS